MAIIGATVTYDPLPLVVGEEMQLTQLLQNLLGNALKFRSKLSFHASKRPYSN